MELSSRICVAALAAIAWAHAPAAVVRAQETLPIDLEVAVVQAAPLGAMQEWGRLLNGLRLARVRLRGANRGDQPSITSTGAGAAQRFRVVGVLNHKDQLVLPGGVFGEGDVADLRRFLEGLPQQAAEQGIERGIFGLTKPQFETIYHDLARPVGTPTQGTELSGVVSVIVTGLRTPVDISAEVRDALARAQPLDTELQGFSAGTVLAIALRPAGLELRPRGPTLETVALKIERATREPDHWPAGWKPDEIASVIAPSMHRFTTIEISGFTLQQALDGGLAPHMGMPLVFDAKVLADRQIDPTKIQVKFPRRKTYVRRAVDNILSQARLAGEVRVDEANKPFYWITQFGPDSPPALGAAPAAGEAGTGRQ